MITTQKIWQIIMQVFKGKRRFIVARLFILAFLGASLWYRGNWIKLFPYQNPENLNQLVTVIMTPLNVQIISVGVLIAITLATAYLINLVFVEFDELNIFGLGFKRKKVEKLANEDKILNREIELTRMVIIKTLNQIMTTAGGFLNGQEFNSWEAAMAIAGAVQRMFSRIDSIEVVIGVVGVEQGTYIESDIANIPIEVRFALKQAQDIGVAWVDPKGRVMAIPLKYNDTDDSYVTLFMTSGNELFIIDQPDMMMVENVWGTIINQANLMVQIA